MPRYFFTIICCLIFIAGMMTELFAQSATSTTANTRRSSLFGASRAGLFSASGERGVDRDTLKARRLEGADLMVQMLDTNDPSRMLDSSGISNMSLFLTTNSAMQRVFNLTATTSAASEKGQLVIGDIDTAVNAAAATTINRATGIYSPRLRFVKESAVVTAEQITQANQLRAAKILTDITDKFIISPDANLTLDINGSAVHIQGRVPTSAQRKKIEIYLGFEPGVYSVKNDLIVDPSLHSEADTTLVAP